MVLPASSNSAPGTNAIFKMKENAKFLSLKRLLPGLALAFFTLSSLAQSFSPLNLPLYFEAGQNQTEFLAGGSGYQFVISPGGVQIALGNATGHATAQMLLAGGNPGAAIHGDAELAGKINYLIGNDSSKWQTGLPTFAQVRVTEVYPGIDVVYHGNQQQLEYDFALAPNADPNRIKIRFAGVDRISITPQGSLVLQIGSSEILQPQPEIYQTVAGAHKVIGGGYKILDAQTVGFEVADYDHSLPLVIDPVLTYSVFFGGIKSATAWAIAEDTSNCTYIAGQTLSKNFFTPNAYQTNYGGGKFAGDVFVAKFDSTGTNLLYLTYLGGTGDDGAFGLAVDANFHAFVTGATESTNFPVTNAIPGHATLSGKIDSHVGLYPADAFVTELDTNGSHLIYSTYLGGQSTDAGYSIALDSSDDAYITGATYSTNFPTTANALLNHLACTNDFYLNANAFVAEITNGGGALVYSTYLGGTNYDTGRAITVDTGNNVYVAGYTASTNFPTWNVPAALSPYLNGVPLKKGDNDNSLDAFVTKFPPLANQPSSVTNLIYSTFLGGTNSEIAYGIAVDPLGNAYVTGFTASTNFPDTNNPPGLFSFLITNGVSGPVATNAFIIKLATNGAVLNSAVFGGRGVDIGYGVAVDTNGDAFVVGQETSTNFPVMNTEAFSTTNSRGYDVFVTAISNDWSRMYYTVLLGGRKDDHGYAIALDASTNVYITGETASTNFPTLNATPFNFNGAPVINGTNSINGAKLSGTNDAFLAEIAFGALPVGPTITTPLPASPQTNGLDTTFTLTIAATGTAPLIYQWQETNAATGVLTNLPSNDKNRFRGVTSNSLTILDAQLTNSGTYFVIVTNNWGAVTDSIDELILSFPPQIIVPPTSQTNGEGSTTYFFVSATGTSPLHYQWQRDGTNLLDKGNFSGVNTNLLIIKDIQTNDAGTYTIIVTNSFGSVSTNATLAVQTFPPVIVSAPPSYQTNGLKTLFALSVSVTGSPPLIYQWQFNGTTLTSKDTGYSGVTNSSLVFKDAQTNQSGLYTVIVTNNYGSATTNIHETILPFPPQITDPPASATNGEGDTAFFFVEATGTSPLHYQWQRDGTNLIDKGNFSGVNTNLLIIKDVQTNDDGLYTIIITNVYGSVSTNATLVVSNYPPDITSAPPLFQTNGIGTTFALTVSVFGSPPLTYQWKFNGVNLTSKDTGYSGANSNSLVFKKATTNESGLYTVVVTNNWGSATTNVNEVIMPFAPQITVPPTNQTDGLGTTVTFPITATGTLPLHYQWQRDGTNLLNKGNISGVNTNTLTITDVQTNQSGTISIIVTNNYGAVTDSVTLTILPLPPQFILLPTNQIVGLGADVSFIVTATGTPPLYYQWQTNGVNLANGSHYSGVNTNTFTIIDATTNDNGTYGIVISNAYGSIFTNATLTVLTVPMFTSISVINSNIANGVSIQIVGGTNSGFYTLFGTSNLLFSPILTTWSNIASGTVGNQGNADAVITPSFYPPLTNWTQAYFILVKTN
jgi:hypothetical protein